MGPAAFPFSLLSEPGALLPKPPTQTTNSRLPDCQALDKTRRGPSSQGAHAQVLQLQGLVHRLAWSNCTWRDQICQSGLSRYSLPCTLGMIPFPHASDSDGSTSGSFELTLLVGWLAFSLRIGRSKMKRPSALSFWPHFQTIKQQASKNDPNCGPKVYACSPSQAI